MNRRNDILYFLSSASWIRRENIILGLVLYGIVLVFIYLYFQMEDKYSIFSPDEIFYYFEAKAVAAHNIYQTPLSLDGNTSFIGNFGSHGISYAVKDGWLSKLFLQFQNPPIILINVITYIAILTVLLSFKSFSLNVRLKIALVVATHYILFSYSLSYMQETIHFLFAVLALRMLYLFYQRFESVSKKYIYTYLFIIIVAITFRYGWFMWGLGLLPLARNFKDFLKWGCIVTGLFLFALFIAHYIYAPYPYEEIVVYRIITTESLSLFKTIHIVVQQFVNNVKVYLSLDVNVTTYLMRYLLLLLLAINTWFAITKKKRFTIACALISWAYFIACMAFYFLTWQADERILAVLNPLLAFSLIGSCHSFIFYPIIIFQLFLFPKVIQIREQNYQSPVPVNDVISYRAAKEASFSRIQNFLNEDKDVVILLPIRQTWHSRPNYIFNLPLVTKKGHAIHYRMRVNGKDLSKTHEPDYIITTVPVNEATHQLIFADNRIYFYKLLF